MKRFKNRIDAGQQLAQKLLGYKEEKPLILALPRGGVPVGFEVARLLEAPLDTLVARKIGAPDNPELGVGAIAPGDVIMIDNNALNMLGLSQKSIEPVIEEEMREMERRIIHYKSGEYSEDSPANLIIIVDDGLATGVTSRAAIESALLQYKPMKIIFAAPACAKETAAALRDLVDVKCLHEAEDFLAVGYWYEDFPQTSDEEVVALLEKAQVFRL
jgi:putative phosphoribosyl transferase